MKKRVFCILLAAILIVLQMPATVFASNPTPNPDRVQLWKGGPYFATMNLGANSPEGYGDYYAWGEIAPYYSNTNPLTWKSGKDNGYAWQSYCGASSFQEWSTSPYDNTSNKLTSEYDAATVVLGSGWRMPTSEEMNMLLISDYCTATWTDSYNGTDVAGLIVSGAKEGYTDKSIFLPAAGYYNGSEQYYEGNNGMYWTSNLSTIEMYADYLTMSSSGQGVESNSITRCNGLSVRAVSELPSISDILPEDFPNNVNDKSWYNSENNNNVYIYKDETTSKLIFAETPFSDGVLISSVLTKADRDQTWSDTTTCRLVYSTDDIEIQFNMAGDEGDELENIIVTRCLYEACMGTYPPTSTISTVDDVLNTVAFPTSEDAAWRSDMNTAVYIDGDFLKFENPILGGEYITFSTGSNLTKDDNNYKYSAEAHELQFEMNDNGTLVKITLTFKKEPFAGMSLVYEPVGNRKSIDYILKTYAKDLFPKNYNDGWPNLNDPSIRMYYYNVLHFTDNTNFDNTCDVSMLCVPENYGYSLSFGECHYDFNINDGELRSVVVSGAFDERQNGTYYAPYAPEARIGDTKYRTVQEAVNAATAGDTVVLLKDVLLDAALRIEKEVALDLDGHVLNRGLINSNGPTDATSDSVIKIINGGNLTLKDSNTNNLSHKFQRIVDGEHKGLLVLEEDSGTEIIKGGCITGGTGSLETTAQDETITAGGGVSVDGGTFQMYGGNIVGNDVTNNASDYKQGGGVYIQDGGKCIIDSGMICGNIADCGGGIDCLGLFTMYGGEISDNICGRNGGGVDYYNGSVTLGGTAKIKDNKKLEFNESTGDITETLNNLYLDDDCVIQFDATKIPTDDMEIGVSLETLPINRDYKKFTNADSNINSKDYNKYFFSDNVEYSIIKKSEYKPSGGYLKDHYLALTGEYPLYVGGTNVNASNKNDVFNDDNDDEDDYGSVHYDPLTHILTLDNATILEDESYGYGISTDLENLIIELKGENKIGNTVVYKDTTIYEEYNIRSGILGSIDDNSDEDIKCDITFTGDGDLTIYDYMSGIYAKNITFDENFKGKLVVEDLGAYVGGESQCAIHAIGDVTIKSGSFDLTSYYSNGIQASGDVLVTGNVDIKINDRVQGINASNVKFDDNFTGTVKIVDQGLDEYEEELDYGCAINASNNVTISGGKFELTSLNSNGIYAGNTVSIEGENTIVKLKGGSESNAIIATTQLDIDTKKLGIINGTEYKDSTTMLNPEDGNLKDGYVIIAKLYTVSFNTNGHGTAVSSVNVVYNEKVSKPADPSEQGYTFGGWYKDADCTQAWNFGTDAVTENITLHAKWIEDVVQKARISGNVTEISTPNSIPVPNASVELFLGTVKVAATVTDASGNYSFENVENGIYNIVVTKDDDSKTKTELVNVDTPNAFTKNVELPDKSVSSVVEVQSAEINDAKSDINKTVVGGLDEIAKNTEVASGSKVTIKLTVVPKNEADVQSANEIKGKAGNGKKVEFLDMSLLKQVNDGTPTDIGGENTKILTIVIPFDFTNVDVSSVMIIRKHGNGAATTLTTTANGDGEYFAIDTQAGTITIYAKKFSDYALAYKEESSTPLRPWRPHRPVTPVTPVTPVEPTFTNPFVDVAEGTYYYDAVLWAAKTGITDGVDATHFAPEIGTTRGQMVTFLWRAAGCPESSIKACPFTDVSEGTYFYEAVLWAFENGITDGTSATTFSPDRNVTRGQAVTFLARLNEVKDNATGYSHNFTDVKSTAYYNNAVAWAFENKISDGTSATTFSPDRDCLRCEIVTYLYRNFVKAE